MYFDTEESWLYNLDGSKVNDLPQEIFDMAVDVVRRIMILGGFLPEDEDGIRVPIPASVVKAIEAYESRAESE